VDRRDRARELIQTPGGGAPARRLPAHVRDNAAVLDLATLGWDDAWADAFEPYAEDGSVPARVAAPHRIAYDVLTADGEVRTRVPGRLRHTSAPEDLPVVGDWVALDVRSRPQIAAVLPRRTRFSRRVAHDARGESAREQVVAANVDVVFVTWPLGDDPSPRVLERYLTLAWESGARPVVLLTKADLEPDPDAAARELADVGGDVPVHAISSRTRMNLEAVERELGRGVTGGLVGPSGAGKSTLVNTIVGEELLTTREVRGDGEGRHTTTRRQLVLLPDDGGLLVDNPGMREVHLWLADQGLEDAFPDIAELAAECRFSDCRHETEPGCAVRAALDEGRLDAERWRSYTELRDELAELESRLARRERARRRGRA
jgi:ribosome biogenesis GTPase